LDGKITHVLKDLENSKNFTVLYKKDEISVTQRRKSVRLRSPISNI